MVRLNVKKIMKLSVLVVCYNQEKFIAQALESILMQQTNFPFEVVIADDYSTDGTVSVIHSLLKSGTIDYRVLQSDQNLGLSLNYQRGFAACRGEYIAVLEGDDYWVSTYHLQMHADQLDKDPDYVLSINKKVIKNEITGFETEEKWPFDADVMDINTEMMIMNNHIGNFSCCMFRKSALDRIDPSMYAGGCADWMHGIVLSEMGKISKMKHASSVYRLHQKGVWSGQSSVEQINKLINHAIPKIDAFLNYRQTHFFQQKSIKLQAKLKRATSFPSMLGNLVPYTIRYHVKRALNSININV
jgi:glycosyltransferase involved in cell wall biosynthesis